MGINYSEIIEVFCYWLLPKWKKQLKESEIIFCNLWLMFILIQFVGGGLIEGVQVLQTTAYKRCYGQPLQWTTASILFSTEWHFSKGKWLQNDFPIQIGVCLLFAQLNWFTLTAAGTKADQCWDKGLKIKAQKKPFEVKQIPWQHLLFENLILAILYSKIFLF